MGLFSGAKNIGKAIKGGAKNIGKGARKVGREVSQAGKKGVQTLAGTLAVVTPTLAPSYTLVSSNYREGFFKSVGSQIGTVRKVIGKTQEQVPAVKGLIGDAKKLVMSAQEIAQSVGVSIPGVDMIPGLGDAGAGAAPQGSLFTPEPTTIGGNGGDDNTMIYLAIGAVVLVGAYLYMRKS